MLLCIFLAVPQITMANLTDGLMAYYPFNGNANDESGNDNNGTVHGATLTTDRFGNTDSAYSFNGTSDLIYVNNSNTININGCIGLSIAAWVKANNDGGIVNKWGPGGAEDDQYILGISSGKIFFGLSDEPTFIDSAISTNKWYFIVGRYDYTTGYIALYINGNKYTDKQLSFCIWNTSQSLFIGKNESSQYFNGIIDDIRIYNRALSESEIQELYQEGANYPLTVTKSGSGNGTVSSNPAGINCGVDCSENYTSGTTAILTATAASGSRFDGWSGGDNCLGTGTCAITMNAEKSVTATFNPVTYSLLVLKSGKGMVTSNPAGIDCGVDCSERYARNTSVTLTATPIMGSTFMGWSGGGCSGKSTCVVSMTANKTVTATFKGPDLVITDIVIDPAAPKASGALTASVTVKNQGTVAGDGGQLTVWSNRTTAATCGAGGNQSVAVGALDAGASKTLTITGLPSGVRGVKSLRAFIDSECAIAESNESNNQFTRQYRVIDSPDFVVTRVILSPGSPTQNGTFNAAVTIKNQGTMSAAAGFLEIWANQSTSQECGAAGDKYLDVGVLGAGASKTVTVSLAAGAAEEKTLRAFVDSWCETPESSDGNNQYTQGYSVQ
ncbi:exported hypothetical protein [Gammaproteobacteria bacterium]